MAKRAMKEHPVYTDGERPAAPPASMNRLIDCFVQVFAIEREKVTPGLAYQSIAQWDSVGHMALVTEIENQFNVTLDTDDIIGMSDVAKAVEILTRHGAAM